MPYGTVNADLMTTSDGVSSSGLYGFKNRIINGAMVIDQRNAGASVTVSDSTKQYTVDRWSAFETTDGVVTAQQVSDAPTGFINSLKITTTTADSSLSTNQRLQFSQDIEGLNVSDLGWGTANAKTITLSFWVKSSLTGTFGGSLANSAADRSYVFTYSIPTASTWTQISVTIAGDTSGTWLTTNGIGIRVYFALGVGTDFQGSAGSWAGALYLAPSGAVSVIGTLNATWQLSGVQLEKGSTATSFDYRPYGTEFLLCQRYFQKLADGASVSTCSLATVVSSDTSSIFGLIPFQVPMRTAPSLATTATSFRANMGSLNANSTTALVTDIVSNINIRISQAGYGGALTTDRSGVVRLNGDTGYVAVTAEL
jgi:hypothetical protein